MTVTIENTRSYATAENGEPLGAADPAVAEQTAEQGEDVWEAFALATGVPILPRSPVVERSPGEELWSTWAARLRLPS